MEFGRAVQRPIDLRVPGKLGEGAGDELREGHDATEVTLVVRIHGRLVLGVVPGAGSLVALHRR